jgi:hypothetical protein
MKKKSKQKRKRAVRNLTRRESTFLEHLRTGTTLTDAARAANYSTKWPGQAGAQAYRSIQKKMPKLLDELGLTYEAWIKRLEDTKNISKHINRWINTYFCGLSERYP